MTSREKYIFFLFLWSTSFWLVHSAALGRRRRENPTERNILFVNKSGRRVDVLWINRHTDPVSYRTNSENGEGYPYGASQGINSFLSHEFQVREMPSKKTGKCRSDECQTAYFQVNEQEGQKITLFQNFTIKHEDARTIARDKASGMLETCQNNLSSERGELSPLELVDAMTECMEVQVNRTLDEQEEERVFQSKVRASMAEKLVPYACADVHYNTSQEVMNKTWHFKRNAGRGYKDYQLQIFHDRPSSRIFQIPQFATTAECEALEFFHSSDGAHIPFDTIHDHTKQGKMVQNLADKFYELARASMGWEDWEFEEQHTIHKQELLDIHRDPDGVTVLPVCTEEDLKDHNEGIDAEPPTFCRLPGANHLQVPTKKFTVDRSNEVASLFLFCGNQRKKVDLGGIHFPNAAVHINPEPNKLVMVVHRSLASPEIDGFTTQYHFCPNHDIFSHTFLVDEEDPTRDDPGTKSDASRNEL